MATIPRQSYSAVISSMFFLFPADFGAIISDMERMHLLRRAHDGFALPTIIIASVILLTILVTSVTAVGSITASLSSQYYNQLAREAAESGVARARACLRNSNYSPTWTDALPLKPDTDCSGTVSGSLSKYIVNNSNIRSSFTVGAPQIGAASSVRVVATGKVELVRTSNTTQVWRTYTYIAAENSRYNDTPQIASGAGWKAPGDPSYRGHNGYMLASTGVLYGWGDNSGFQLGDASLGTIVSTPVTIALPTDVSKAKKVYSSGQGASVLCILATHFSLGDQIYCRGAGLSLSGSAWQRFGLGAGLTAMDMALNGYGVDAACVKASDLQVYCAGDNFFGQFGTTTTVASNIPITSPVKFRLDLASPGPVVGSAASLTVQKVFHQDLSVCVIASDNQAYCAGINNMGQLGQSTFTTNVGIGKSIPGRAQIPGNPSVLDVIQTYHASAEAIYFRVADGTVYMSGSNRYGTANDGADVGSCAVSPSYNCYNTPRAINWGGFGRTISIGREGGDYNAVCNIGLYQGAPGDSAMWCMGRNSYGQLGLGDCNNRTSNTAYSPVNGERVNYQMNAEATYQMNSLTVITIGGNAYSAGDNTYGKLGTGAPLQTCNPNFARVQLPAGVKAVAVANGDEYSTFILGDNGRVYAMGRNNTGQLGDGTTTNRSVPIEVKLPRQATLY